MKFELRKRKDWNESAVSEIVGNILILMITVVLFSGIMGFVSQMPVPQQVTKADFSAGITFNTAGTEADLTLTHAGGDSLDPAHTLILWEVDSVTYSQKLYNDTSFTNDRWTMGVDWSRHLTGLTYSSSIYVTVYDLDKNSAIWMGQVSGGTTGTPPSILQRYADSNPITPSVDPIKQYDDFTLFVKVIDLDGDLDTTDGVWVDSTSITNGTAHDTPERSASGWYEWDFTDVANSIADIDGKVIVIHAEDEANHASVASFVVSVIVLPTNVEENWYESPQSVGESGLPAYLSWISQRQGFGVYKENLSSPGTANISLPSTSFIQGEKVFVRVGSLDMSNIFGANTLTLTDTRTGYSSTSYADFILTSTEDDPFYAYAAGGNAFVYEAKFNTTDLAPSSYAMHIELMSGSTSSYVFQIDQIITISAEDSPISFIPAIWLFNGANAEWGTKTTPFEVSGSTYYAYINLYVQDTGSTSDVRIEDVRIVDMSGSPKLNGAVPSGTMISAVSVNNTETPANAYTFRIDLRVNNQDQWLEGTNAYTLFISRFIDANEGEYSISKQIYIEASLNKADFVLGTLGMYASQSSGSGSANFQPPQYLFYVENNNFFTMRTLFDYSNSPGSTLDYWVTALSAGDLDGDGDKDLLMGQYYSNYLYYFENSMNTYGSWQEGSVLTRPDGNTTRIEWISSGDVNGDGDTDFAYSTSGHRVVIYNNTYGSKGVLFPKTWNATNDGIRKIVLQDMTRDGKADLIVLAEGRVELYDLKDWSIYAKATVPGSGIAATLRNIEDFDIYDVNGDSWPDILTTAPYPAYVSGSTSGKVDSTISGVWVNNYTASTSPVVKTLNTAVSVCVKGSIVAATVSETTADDESYMSIAENATGTAYDTSPLGAVDYRFQFQTLAVSQDQELRIKAKVKTGHEESFYLWYSIQSATPAAATIWTPLLTLNSETFTEYAIPLPSTVSGKALLIRFTDSSDATSSAAFVDQLDIDYIGVYTSIFGGYMTTRYQPVPHTTDNAFTAVRAGRLDADAYIETIVAKNNKWVAYENTTASTLWTGTNTGMYVEGSTKGAPSTSIAAFLAYVSPTLFDVVDINGDGYDDVILSNYTIDSDIISQVGIWVNLMDAKWFVEAKDLTDMFSPDDVKGGLTWLLVSDLTEGE